MMEVLVAMAILAMLGTAVVAFLRSGLAAWRVAETRGDAYARAQTVLDRLRDDLDALASDSGRCGSDVRLLSDYDAKGNQRLRFVRTVRGEGQDPILRDGGLFVGAEGEIDRRGDLAEREFGALRASGGLQEVAYFLDPAGGNLLYRAERTPIGGGGSLLGDASIAGSPPGLGEPLAGGIAYIEWNFWSQWSGSWRTDLPARPASPASVAGPCTAWDSTRARSGGSPVDFPFVREGSQDRPIDDIVPARIQATIVLEPAWIERYARLDKDISPEEGTIAVDSTRGYPEPDDPASAFIRIDGEWIRYAVLGDRTFEKVERGRRGSRPAAHKRGTDVFFGVAFVRVLDIPCAREDWSEDAR
ncbi:MAG: hypothetical protein JXP34_04290 [Planctomycetes bacterium]|nr:hypothetical protein [Planctomycetota bacterium]